MGRGIPSGWSVLKGPQRKFCEGIVKGLTGEAAYLEAYPKATKATARANAARLLANAGVSGEVQRLRDKADEKAGSAVLTLVEIRSFLARVVRMKGEDIDLEKDGDLVNGVRLKEFGRELLLPDKLRAIEVDGKYSGLIAADKVEHTLNCTPEVQAAMRAMFSR